MTVEGKKEITRKEFMKGMSMSLAGVAMAGSVGGLLTACSNATGDASVNAGGESKETPQWPFKYVKLDPEKVEKAGYEGYKEGACCYGVINAFLSALSDEVGYPFNQIPADAFRGGGTGYGQGALCGSLGSAAACIGMVCDGDQQKELIAELYNWYKIHPFPQYQPAGMDLITTEAKSVLCIDSVGKFMEAQGVGMADPERKERCAAVTAEVARKMVEILNEKLA